MKTVRQLSEQIGIAKQSVDYHVKKLNESYIKEGNVNMIDYRLEQLIIERVNNNRQHTTYEQQQASVESDNGNTNVEDKESNNDTDYIQHLKDEVAYLRESLKTNQQLLDQQQQLTQSGNNKISQLENEIEQYRFKLEDNSNQDNKRVLRVRNRVRVNDVEDADIKEDTHTTASNVEDVEDNVKEDKPKRTWLDKILGLNR